MAMKSVSRCARFQPWVLFLLCLVLGHNSLVLGRTVREHREEATDERDHPWGLDQQDTGEDFWPILCPQNNWFSKEQDECVVCSSCPDDHFITTPCYRFHDTKCSPLQHIPEHFFTPVVETGGNGLLLRRGGQRHRQAEDQWRPATVALGVIVGVLVLALLVTSVAVCVVWRQQQDEETPKAAEKLVCSYSPAPSETV